MNIDPEYRYENPVQGPTRTLRTGFHEITSGWTLIDDVADLTDRIERAAEWTKIYGPLLEGEQATIRMMIESQIARSL